MRNQIKVRAERELHLAICPKPKTLILIAAMKDFDSHTLQLDG